MNGVMPWCLEVLDSAYHSIECIILEEIKTPVSVPQFGWEVCEDPESEVLGKVWELKYLGLCTKSMDIQLLLVVAPWVVILTYLSLTQVSGNIAESNIA